MPGRQIDRMTDLTGRTILVTGASSGLGLATARALTSRGATVIAAVRNPAKAAEFETVQLDLADLASVRACAGRIRERYQHIDVLINNAGVMIPPFTAEPEVHFAVNHLGHFALTMSLLDLLGRVVTVTSTKHRSARTPFPEGVKSPMDAYNRSKLANAVFGVELQRRLTAGGQRARSVLAHPGYAVTAAQAGADSRLWRLLLTRIANPLIGQPAERAILPILHAALDPFVAGGALYGPDGRGELRGNPKRVELSPIAADRAVGRELWERSEKLTGVVDRTR